VSTPRRIFVVGYMHSGTTLVRDILGNHPALYMARTETKFFMHLGLIRRAWGDLDAPGTDDAFRAFCEELLDRGFPTYVRPSKGRGGTTDLGRSSSTASPLRRYGGVLREVLDGRARAASAQGWVEKTPTHIYNADEIRAAIPDATFVEIVRDPRDVLASKKTRKETVGDARYGQPEDQPVRKLIRAYDPLLDALSWKSAIRAGDAARTDPAGRWLRLRYEDLVAEPVAVTTSLCGFLDLPFREDLLEVHRGVPAEADEFTRETTGVVGTSQGRWRTVLRPAELEVIQRVCRPEMAELGYAAAETGRDRFTAFVQVGAASIPGLAGRALSRLRLGGPAYLRDVLRGYARRARRITKH
jgi:hypothetical protein